MTTRWYKLKARGWRRVVLELPVDELVMLVAYDAEMVRAAPYLASNLGETARAIVFRELYPWQKRRCAAFRSKAHAWFHRAAPLRSSKRDDAGIFPAVRRRGAK